MTSADATRRAVAQSVAALDRWISANGWAGYDPHDVRGTPVFMFLLRPMRSVPMKIVRRLVLAPLTMFERAYPRLTRRLLGVTPTVNAKGMALFARGYLQLWSATGNDGFRTKAIECLDWLEANRSPGYDEPAWGYPFDWQSGVITPARTPASVVTSAVGDAFWTAYRTLGDRRYLAICEGVCRGFLQYLRQDHMADGSICFSYTPLDDFHVHNANLLVAEYLARVGTETGNAEWVDIGVRAGSYALKEQNPDGSLYYWGRIQDWQCPKCIDHYHSGFEIRCLHALGKVTGRREFLDAAARYYRFYREQLLVSVGDDLMPKMTPAAVYPVNIHSCAEALMVAGTLADDFAEARESLDPIARWVVANMQTPAGSFVYMRRRSLGRTVVHAFPYMRWAQGWMLLALSQYLVAQQREARAAA